MFKKHTFGALSQMAHFICTYGLVDLTMAARCNGGGLSNNNNKKNCLQINFLFGCQTGF